MDPDLDRPANTRDPTALLMVLSFIESFATVLIERGIYYFAHERLAFSNRENLGLGLGIGAFYVIGAMVSHRLATRLGERASLLALLVLHVVCHLTLAWSVAMWAFLGWNFLLAMVTGMKWPIIESYFSAGRDAEGTFAAVGKFSIAWSLSVPLAMAAAGPIVGGAHPMVIFLLPAAVNVLSLLLVSRLPVAPAHRPAESHDRADASEVSAQRALLSSSRWSMAASYVLLFVLVPLMPGIYRDMGYSVQIATSLAGLVEVARLAAFVTMFFAAGWHGKRGLLIVAAVCLPLGFVMVIAGGHVSVVLAGEIVFGLAAGAAYYAALYYAMLVANASVESGGAHEMLVGLGFAVGPGVGLIGSVLTPWVGSEMTSIVTVSAPVGLAAMAWSLWVLRGRPLTGPR